MLGDRKIVSMIANITEFKDHETLIAAWRLIRDHFKLLPPVLLLAGHQRDQASLKRLKLQAFDLGLSGDDIKFLGPVGDVSSLIAASNLMVHSSITEGCPNAVCEAMALGKAVVATDIPGTQQALGEQGQPWLAAPKDSAGLARRIIDLLEDGALCARVGHDNHKRVQSEFSIGAMNLFYQRLIEKQLGVGFDASPHHVDL
jgi:glycosyltransferase involved in cell wall biosynthesis